MNRNWTGNGDWNGLRRDYILDYIAVQRETASYVPLYKLEAGTSAWKDTDLERDWTILD